MLYRIFTEDKNREKVERICSQTFEDGFTLIEATGYYQSSKEKSIIIEWTSTRDDAKTLVDFVALNIARANKQTCCLVQIVKDYSYLVSNPAAKGGE